MLVNISVKALTDFFLFKEIGPLFSTLPLPGTFLEDRLCGRGRQSPGFLKKVATIRYSS